MRSRLLSTDTHTHTHTHTPWLTSSLEGRPQTATTQLATVHEQLAQIALSAACVRGPPCPPTLVVLLGQRVVISNLLLTDADVGRGGRALASTCGRAKCLRSTAGDAFSVRHGAAEEAQRRCGCRPAWFAGTQAGLFTPQVDYQRCTPCHARTLIHVCFCVHMRVCGVRACVSVCAVCMPVWLHVRCACLYGRICLCMPVCPHVRCACLCSRMCSCV